jgi:hypothetical protein
VLRRFEGDAERLRPAIGVVTERLL